MESSGLELRCMKGSGKDQDFGLMVPSPLLKNFVFRTLDDIKDQQTKQIQYKINDKPQIEPRTDEMKPTIHLFLIGFGFVDFLIFFFLFFFPTKV